MPIKPLINSPGFSNVPSSGGGGGGGDVSGPASAVSGSVAIFNGITGKLITDLGANPLVIGDPSVQHIEIQVVAGDPTITLYNSTGAANGQVFLASGGIGIYNPTTGNALRVQDDGTFVFEGGNIVVSDTINFVLDGATGTKIGTGTAQKLGFYNATPVVQGASVADATGGVVIDAEARVAINALISRLEATGLIATV